MIFLPSSVSVTVSWYDSRQESTELPLHDALTLAVVPDTLDVTERRVARLWLWRRRRDGVRPERLVRPGERSEVARRDRPVVDHRVRRQARQRLLRTPRGCPSGAVFCAVGVAVPP